MTFITAVANKLTSCLRLETKALDHKINRRLFSEVINQVRSRAIFS